MVQTNYNELKKNGPKIWLQLLKFRKTITATFMNRETSLSKI